MVVDPRGRDVRVPKPRLHLGGVGLVIEGVRSGSRAQRVPALPPKSRLATSRLDRPSRL